ncbi:MAG: S9 family peptidase, partial [Ktedonobacterales bacterium]
MAKRLPLTSDDFWELAFITEMRLSPDKRRVVYSLQRNDRAANERRSSLWLLDLVTGATHQLTLSGKSDTSPRWSPDGAQIAFIRQRTADDGEGAQLWLLPADGGEARQLTHMRRGASAPFWSADGAWIGFESETREGEEAILTAPLDAETREREKKDEAERPRIVTRLQYRWDGKGYFEGRTHLFRTLLDDGQQGIVRVEQLTDGDYDDEEGACSPDGRYLAFVSDRSDERDANMTSDLWLLDLTTHELRRLTAGAHAVAQPAWSPDGGRITYLATPQVHKHSVYNVALMVADRENGASVNLLAGLDESAESGLYNDTPGPHASAPIWSADGQAVYFLAQRRGAVHLLRASVTGGGLTSVLSGDDAHIEQVALALGEERILALRCDPVRPWDIWEYRQSAPGQHKTQQLTSVNGDLLAARALAAPERFTYRSFDGQEIEGWLYRPTNRRNGTHDAPLALKIHGGPHGAYGESFYLSVQILVGKGYAVLYTNPRGSTGYGEQFAQACDHDWGGGDYRDVLAGVDAALAQGGLDGERLAVFGASYGGYMTNWIVGQTDRFKAAVTVNSVTNLLTSFGTGDIDSVWAEGDYGWPWEREAQYRERSPLTYAARITTPLRIIAAENDYRCPISQSEELYTWLKVLGKVPVDFVRMPGASHGVH